MISSPQLITDVQWWYNKINCFKNNITKGQPVFEFGQPVFETLNWNGCLIKKIQ